MPSLNCFNITIEDKNNWKSNIMNFTIMVNQGGNSDYNNSQFLEDLKDGCSDRTIKALGLELHDSSRTRTP